MDISTCFELDRDEMIEYIIEHQAARLTESDVKNILRYFWVKASHDEIVNDYQKIKELE